ncbi:MAG TPA: hypothetical protein VK745_29795 [Polyangiaceae bacterium]|nr:hypothetical protein [Polyangiaceae bacterium]
MGSQSDPGKNFRRLLGGRRAAAVFARATFPGVARARPALKWLLQACALVMSNDWARPGSPRVLLAFLVAVSSVMLGAALSFVPSASRGLLGYMRTFATLSAVAVVVTHLLPEALHDLGALSILLFLMGWFAPALAHFIGQRSTSGRPAHAVLEAGYWGLVVHHVADGIGLGTYTRLPAAEGSHLDVVVALAAHTVPLIAVVSLAYRTTFGARSAVTRSLGLALASVFGIALSSLVAASTIDRFAPVIAAIAAGLLLHVVTHDLTEDPPRSARSRVIDLAVAGLGVAVSLLGVERNADPATWEFVRHLALLARRTAPAILVGLALAALALRSLHRGSKFARVARPSGVLGLESALLGVALFGFASTALRLLVTAFALKALGAAPELESDAQHDAPRGWLARVSETLALCGPWLVLGLVVGALLSSVGSSQLSRSVSGSLLELFTVAIVANVTPVSALAALLIAAGVSELGCSSGAALLFATLAPLLAERHARAWQRLAMTLLCCVVAWLSNLSPAIGVPLDGSLPGGSLAAIALLGLLLCGVWQRGARIWLSSIVRTPAHEHEHAHDVHGPHGHGHGH